MGRERRISSEAYKSVTEEAKSKGSATFAGEQRHREGRGLHELVDPKGYGLIRRSLGFMEPKGTHFILVNGVAMLEESRLDTTGSMGDNVEIAMEVLPKTYDLLAKGPRAVLARYDTQMITSIFGDVCDNYVLCRSQAEMDERIAEQMTLMVPEGDGGDVDEDPQYGIFAGAYLTDAHVKKYGLKHYDFTITDACGRHRLSVETLKRVFGEQVFEKVKENGYDIDSKQLPTTKEVVRDLLKIAHAFVLRVGHNSDANEFWTDLYGKERVVFLPEVRLLPEVKAAIIGLTEGVLTLQDVEEFLITEAKTSKANASLIRKAVAGIPIGAQMALPNFDKIPAKGSIFAKKDDLWPMDSKDVEGVTAKTPKKEKKDMWK